MGGRRRNSPITFCFENEERPSAAAAVEQERQA